MPVRPHLNEPIEDSRPQGYAADGYGKINGLAAIVTTFNADFQNQSISPPTGDNLVWSPTNSQTRMLGLINAAQHTLLAVRGERARQVGPRPQVAVVVLQDLVAGHPGRRG